MILDLIPLRYHSRPENLDPIDKCGVGVKFDNIEILDSVCNLKLLLTLEAFYIRQRRPGLNTRDEFRSRALSSTCFSPPVRSHHWCFLTACCRCLFIFIFRPYFIWERKIFKSNGFFFTKFAKNLFISKLKGFTHRIQLT